MNCACAYSLTAEQNLLLILLLFRTALAPYCSVSRFDTRTLRTQRRQQYIRENGCARSVVCLLYAVVSWVFSGWRLLVKGRKLEKSQRTTANSRHITLRAQPFSRTYCCWRCVLNVRVSNLDTLVWASIVQYGVVTCGLFFSMVLYCLMLWYDLVLYRLVRYNFFLIWWR